jgi:carbon storage regulator
MLCLSRRIGEQIVISGSITVTVVAVNGKQIRLGFTMPEDVTVDRAEVYQRKRETECKEAMG